jgi:NAD(P)-dependent dehydrogenase (short-subunit alcohol dehydrogenase family)
VALVIGGGQIDEDFTYPGTGAATAALLAAEGASVAILGRTATTVDRTVGYIADHGGGAFAVLGDATRDADCKRAADETVERFGSVDILVNNLGTAVHGSVVDLEVDEWDRSLRVNLTSVLLASKHVIPYMAAARRGSIINIGSGSGVLADGAPAYGTAKAGLTGLTRHMALMHGPDGVRVNCVVLGPVHTPMVTGYPGLPLFREVSMLGIEGTGWDVGWAVVFLASDEARYVTATVLAVDGGTTAEAPLSVALRMRSPQP